MHFFIEYSKFSALINIVSKWSYMDSTWDFVLSKYPNDYELMRDKTNIVSEKI